MLTESQHVDTAVCSLQSNRFMIVRFAFFMKHRRYGVGWSWLSATYSVIAFEGYTLFFLFFSFFFFQRAVMELFIPVWGLHEVFTAESTLNYVKLQQSVCSSEISWWNVSRRSADFILFFFPHCETNLSTDVALNREGSCQFGIPPLSTPLNSAIYGSTQASTLSLT